jgi:hypothetical protein
VLFDASSPPILVILGEDGRLRAFLDMCTHRGARTTMFRSCTEIAWREISIRM